MKSRRYRIHVCDFELARRSEVRKARYNFFVFSRLKKSNLLNPAKVLSTEYTVGT